MRTLPRLASALLISSFIAGCAPSERTVEVDPGYIVEIEKIRAERLARLTAEDGWLTLVGLFWLAPGENTVGSNPVNAVALPAGAAPPTIGTLELSADGSVWFEPKAGLDLTVNGEPASPGPLVSDWDGAPDLVRAGRLTFFVISRGERLGVRVKDPEGPVRSGFEGLEHFPIDPGFRVEAHLEAYPEPREVEIPTVVGTVETMLAPGTLRFELGGHRLSLEPFVQSADDDRYFIVFSDATSGSTTYGAGRFLSADAARDGVAWLDFNLAVSPPCAFTPFATCPLPPPGNRLDAAVTAGEMHRATH